LEHHDEKVLLTPAEV